MTNISENSLFAYESIKPVIGKMRNKVLAIIKIHGECTSFDIAKALNLSIHKVTGRINELMYDCQAINIIKVVEPRKRNVYAVRDAHDPFNVRSLTPEQKLKQFKSWIGLQGNYVATQKCIDKINELIMS
jgi:predicted transcriptional regulator